MPGRRILLLCCSLVAIGLAGPSAPIAAALPNPPNIVFVLTDDQRYDELTYMPTLQAELADKGIQFTNAFVSDPLCCPSRSTILTGRYSHSTGVYENLAPNGGFEGFGSQDQSTIATWLHAAGYETAMVGKYLNGYDDPSYIPPGWDAWHVFARGGADDSGKRAYYGYSLSDQGVLTSYPKTTSPPYNYSTEVLAEDALDFVREASPDQPIFLYFSPRAPHKPALPYPGDARALRAAPKLRPPNYNEADVTDKPAYIRSIEPWTQSRKRSNDAFYHDQLEALLDVDRAVGRILQALEETGRLSNTLFVFTSDNGEAIGENRWRGKTVPYEASIRVPLVVRFDPLTLGHASTDASLIVNTDFAPTFAQTAGVDAPGVDGMSFLPLLVHGATSWRSDFLVEHLNGDGTVPTYCGVRTEDSMYLEYQTGETEFYDLKRDPWELQNEAGNPAQQETIQALRERLLQLCSPPPPGFTP
jgi:arylsulfatase A-like enzyme